MPEYDNTNSGRLFKNDRKEKDSHPDLNGHLNVNGEEFWISAWKKEGSAGRGPFYSIAIKPKEEQATTKKPAGKKSFTQEMDENDDLI